ncbi:hypothetical protein AALO_G00038220 [Alosa alosa]|uniref:THAP-type domain-containing protein n=2 Tax=Alosa alosa TaxID=278164 RepID=A0AAV6H7A6_9TELE|nr:uncharacterized protein LOC125292669 isoform X1 [Alosa alosa]KAG5283093.1 hypothetical protein AALO_G00038220 [Alosa alosa]
MVHTCVVAGCRNRRTPGTTLSFYRFPRDPERKQRWIAAVNREGWVPNDGSRLCSNHFISGKQVKNPRSPDYVPSVFTTTASLSETMKEASTFELSDKQEAQVEAANALLFLQGQGRFTGEMVQNQGQDQEPDTTSSSTSSDDEDEDEDDSDEMGQMSDCKGKAEKLCRSASTRFIDYEASLKALRRENRALRESVEKMSLTEASLRNDPEKVCFYTGLPNYFVFETVMWLLAPHMKGDKNSKLSKFQQLLLTLMRLRLDLRNQDLAYRFGVKVATVTRTVHRIINIMSATLVPTAVFWPSRVELRKNLPAALTATHPDCAVIIDCFRVSLERPIDSELNQQVPTTADGRILYTPRAYGANELKYLIGVAPQGVVTFVSRGSPGNVSDKCLAEGCGFLCKLLPGDVVLASHDLDIAESVAARGAQLKVTGSSGVIHGEGFPEMSRAPWTTTNTITPERLSVHRHVEKVISMVKKRYAILTGPVESPFTAVDRASSMTTFDKIVQVACALNNLCISAAPLE